MANNTIQIKRTSVSGRTPNTTISANSQYIRAGELALNMPDRIVYTSDGSNLIPIGANNVNVRVSNTLTVNAISANNSLGSYGQVLTSSGSGLYWDTPASGGGGSSSVSLSYVVDEFTGNGSVNTYTLSIASNTDNSLVFINGVQQQGNVAYTISSNTITFAEDIAASSNVVVRTPQFTTFSPPTGYLVQQANTITTSNTDEQTVDAFSSTVFRSASYYVQVTDNTNGEYHTQNINLLHNGTTVFMSEYAALYTNSSLATFDGAIAGSMVYLNVTPVVANSTIFVVRTSVA